MRDSMKITVPYQIWITILTHIEAAGIAFVFQTVAFWYFIGKGVFKPILGIIFTLIYAGFIYHVVRKLAIRDYKSYTPLKPSVFKGVMLGVILSLITALLFVSWKLVWMYSSTDGSLNGAFATIINLVFTYWTFPFFGIMGTYGDKITIVGQIVMFAVPIIASTAGYLSAKYNIDLADMFQRSVYEKPEDDNE